MELNYSSINQNVLGKIVAAKQKRLEQRKIDEPLDSFINDLKPSDRSLKTALTINSTNFILECKKASPSKGLIRPDFNPSEIAKVYKQYAQAISVLAEEDFFQGDLSYINMVRQNVDVPVICKDFFVDPYQVYLARKYQADAILLMLSVLTDESYTILANIAKQYNLDIITEVSNEEEIERALNLGAEIIGINNRNLRNLTVDLNRTRILSKLIPDDKIKICESGINTNLDVRSLSPLVNGFLIGSSLTAQQDIDNACKKLIFGNIKICGLTSIEDAKLVSQNGATFGGLIFCNKSPRCIDLEKARLIVEHVNLNYVGVFVNEDLNKIVEIATKLKLTSIQLHGNESLTDIMHLKEQLPTTEIWKAIPIKDNDPEVFSTVAKYIDTVDRIVFDTKHNDSFGGTGKTFDWNIISNIYSNLCNEKPTIPKNVFLNKIIIAGGLNPNNADLAVKVGTFGLDFNSGVEKQPGIKDQQKLVNLFKILRNY